MAENIYFDLSDEIEQDLLSRYQSLCDELNQQLGTMCSQLEEICAQTQYEPIVNVVNTTINLFNEDIYGVADQAFEEWRDGDGSFTAAAENSQSGEAAYETARQIESSIRDIFEMFWSNHPMGDGIQLDTSRPKVKSEDFDELKEIYTRSFQNVEEIGEETAKQIIDAGSDDPTYNIIIPAVKAITEPMKNAFEQFCSKIDEAKENSESLKQQQDTRNEEAVETATQTSASAAEIAESLNMYSDI